MYMWIKSGVCHQCANKGLKGLTVFSKDRSKYLNKPGTLGLTREKLLSCHGNLQGNSHPQGG